jgi:hypothetical protein
VGQLDAGTAWPADGSEGPAQTWPSKSVYETARLLPLGEDDGFAERFLEERVSKARDTPATHDL